MKTSIELREGRRDAEVAEAPALLRDAHEIIATRAFPNKHEQEMLQIFVTTNPAARKHIGERFSISGCILAEDLPYALSIVQNAAFQAAAKREYAIGEGPHGNKFVAANTSQGQAAFADAINIPTALNFMANIIRHVKKDASCSNLSYHEISVQAADAIVPLSRALSNMSANQVQKFMEFATTDSQLWKVEKKEYEYQPDFFKIERESEKIRIRPTEKFQEYLKLAREMRPVPWDREGTAFCPMFATKGKDDAYRLLLECLQLTLKKIEDVKTKTP